MLPHAESTRRCVHRRRIVLLVVALAVASLVWTNLRFWASDDVDSRSGMGPSEEFFDHKFFRDFNTSVPIREKRKPSNATKPEKEQPPLEIDIRIDDGPVYPAPIVNATTRDFDPTLNGVIVTKMQGGTKDVDSVKQMLCLFSKAYNNRVHHDIIVFTSEAVDEKEISAFQEIVHPAKLRVQLDNPGLHEMVDALPMDQKQVLLERCNATSTSDLTWRTRCWEVGSFTTTHEMISYNWQAEFRSKWLWEHELLKPYKYMMWMDSDAFCTQTWQQDPFAVMQRHNLVLLFDHFPQGMSRGYEFPRLTKQVFGRVICKIELRNGTLVATDGKCQNRPKSRLKNVHGFFHVSSLDFYRSPQVQKWNNAMITNRTKFSRLFDDQIGITIPAAVLEPQRSRDMRGIGVYPRVFHNYMLDGRHEDWRGYFEKYFERNVDTMFPEASVCEIKLNG